MSQDHNQLFHLWRNSTALGSFLGNGVVALISLYFRRCIAPCASTWKGNVKAGAGIILTDTASKERECQQLINHSRTHTLAFKISIIFDQTVWPGAHWMCTLKVYALFSRKILPDKYSLTSEESRRYPQLEWGFVCFCVVWCCLFMGFFCLFHFVVIAWVLWAVSVWFCGFFCF